MMRRLASSIVRRYPTPWRERYEAEVLSLIEDSQVRLIDLAEFVRGLIVERAKSLVEPGDSPRLSGFAYRSMAWTVRVAPSVSLVLGAAILAEVARAKFGHASDTVSVAGASLLVGVLLVFMRRKWVTRSQRVSSHRMYAFFSRPARVAMLSGLFVAVFLIHWQEPAPSDASLPFMRWLQLWPWMTVADALTLGFLPWRTMLDALDQYGSAKTELWWAQLEVYRHRRLIDSGVPVGNDLVNAEIARDRLIQKRDTALAVMHRFGYRAKFGQPE